MSLLDLLLGRPLATEEEPKERVGPLAGVALCGLDALASAAYGPEAALTVLIPIGRGAPRYALPVSLLVTVLLFIVYLSYRQTIAAYPSGGGSYTVAKENLGTRAGLLAASALGIDYVLNVAVAISAGVGALVSALPPLLPHTLSLCLGILAMLTLVNLRGTRQAGLAFLLPTYLFVGCLSLVIVIGGAKMLLAAGHPVPVEPPPPLPPATMTVTAWLLMRAFANGCTAMTGVEAVSNAVPIFRQPTTLLARRALSIIVLILALFLVGIGVLCRAYQIGATPPGARGYQSVLSQLVAAVTGRGMFYGVSIAAILAVLTLSANTSFTDFPRVCRLLAVDHFLPDTFAHRGRRLVFSHGITTLTILSGTLLVAFHGITDRLIPLFAIGAFLAFTLSQAGMVMHWWRVGRQGAWYKLVINAIGASATAVTVIVVLVSKFTEGAWITAFAVPALFLLFRRMQRHHAAVFTKIRSCGRLEIDRPIPPIAVVPLESWTCVAQQALLVATRLSPDVRAVQLMTDEPSFELLTPRWPELVEAPMRAHGLTPPRLEVISTAYRQLVTPLVQYIERLEREHPARQIAVVVPELVELRPYHLFLHNQKATLLKTLLLLKGRTGVIIVTVPWYLHD
jgi:amino acid transporter